MIRAGKRVGINGAGETKTIGGARPATKTPARGRQLCQKKTLLIFLLVDIVFLLAFTLALIWFDSLEKFETHALTNSSAQDVAFGSADHVPAESVPDAQDAATAPTASTAPEASAAPTASATASTASTQAAPTAPTASTAPEASTTSTTSNTDPTALLNIKEKRTPSLKKDPTSSTLVNAGSTPDEIFSVLKNIDKVPTVLLANQVVPMSAGSYTGFVWALANLVIALLGAVLVLVATSCMVLQSRTVGTFRDRAFGIAALFTATLLAVADLLFFFFIEDTTKLMVMTDSQTWLSALLLILEAVFLAFAFVLVKSKKKAIDVDETLLNDRVIVRRIDDSKSKDPRSEAIAFLIGN